MLPMLFHIERVTQVRLLGVFLSILLNWPCMSILCSLSSTNAFIYFLSLKLKGPSDSLQIIFHALILSKVEYALPAITSSSLFVLNVRMSPLFIKGYSTWLDWCRWCLTTTTRRKLRCRRRRRRCQQPPSTTTCSDSTSRPRLSASSRSQLCGQLTDQWSWQMWQLLGFFDNYNYH